jgi:MFS family permease
MPSRSFTFQRHHAVWLWLFTAWMFCYIDRAITGPTVSWMLENKVAFFAAAPMPYALAGVIGSMFFAGYMLTQYPAGRLGDRHGRKVMIVISLVWASLTTLASGFARSLSAFVGLRVLTGLGEGAYYSNDRALVAMSTPERSRGMGMGVVFVGLAAGLTVATVATPPLLTWASEVWGKEAAWAAPFLLFAPPTLLVALGLHRCLRIDEPGASYRRGAIGLLAYAAPLFAVVMAAYFVTLEFRLSSLLQAVVITTVALSMILLVFRSGGGSPKALRSRDMVIMYISAIPVLYTLWFFGFWALMVVAESSKAGVSGAVAYAALFGVASAAGYPLGGYLYDRRASAGKGRRGTYVLLALLLAAGITALAAAVSAGTDVVVTGGLLFLIGVLFSAMQTAHMTLTSDLAPPERMAEAFGLWNLVAEVGAVISPVLSGTLRDATGNWTAAIVLDAGLVAASALMVLAVREPRQGRSAGTP